MSLETKEYAKRLVEQMTLEEKISQMRYESPAIERCRLLQNLDLSGVDVNMFTAVNNSLMNDGCGLFRGRLILPYEHLSKFQNDMID